MIKAMIFDLDGTLVQTEPLKNLAYLHAARELSSNTVDEAELLEACIELIGVSAPATAMALMQRSGLEEAARTRMAEFGADAPWQAFSKMQLRFYDRILDDPQILHGAKLPHNIALLHKARQAGYKTALATMSYRAQTQRILDILGLTGTFDFVATQDDVENSKPDPEVYQLVAWGLAIPPTECLVIEDSLAGVQSALRAGMWCIAVPTSFTNQTVHAGKLLDERWIVDDPARLTAVVQQMLAERKQDS